MIFTRRPRRTEHIVEHEGGELTYVLPAYRDLAVSQNIVESKGLCVPTFAELSSIVYDALKTPEGKSSRFSNEKHLRIIRKLLESHILLSSTGVFTVPHRGFYIVDRCSVGSDGRPIRRDLSEIERKLEQGEPSVRIIPSHIRESQNIVIQERHFGRLGTRFYSHCTPGPFEDPDLSDLYGPDYYPGGKQRIDFLKGLAGEKGAQKLIKAGKKFYGPSELIMNEYIVGNDDPSGSKLEANMSGISLNSYRNMDGWSYNRLCTMANLVVGERGFAVVGVRPKGGELK